MPAKQKVNKNTINKGHEYEQLVPAAIFWNLLKHQRVRSFEMCTNLKNFGLFDDLIIWISKDNAEKEAFAFQLKHKDDEQVKLFDASHLNNSKDFKLEKYRESYNRIPQKDDYNFIMFTNACFNFNNIEDETSYQINNRVCPGQAYFFLPGKKCLKASQNVTTFQENNDDFFNKFSFYSGQKNWNELQRFIANEFKENFFDRDETFARDYQEFFRNWKMDRFSKIKLTKEEIIFKIIDITLSRNIITPVISEDNKRFRVLEEALKQFRISVVKHIDKELLKKLISGIYVQENEDILHLAKDDKFLTKEITLKDFLDDSKLKTDTKLKIGYYRKGQPIIVEMSETNKLGIINTVLKFPEETRNLHFLLCGNVTKEDFPNILVFQNLHDLLKNHRELFTEIVKELKIKLLNREYSYEAVFGFDEEVAKQITIKEMYEMLAGTYEIKVPSECLSEPYISRTVSTTLIKIESLDQIDNDILVISSLTRSCTDKLKTVLKKKGIVETLDEQIKQDCHILLENKSIITKETLNQIPAENPGKNVHYLKEYNEEYIEWIWSKGSIKELKKCDVEDEFCVKEKYIHEHFLNGINVVISRPGMGKSEMLKKLYNLCSPDYFPIKINLKEHNLFFRKKRSGEEILDYCTNQSNDFFLKKTVASFVQKKRVIFFFDGIDELYSDLVDIVLNSIEELHSSGFRLWVSARPNLLETIEEILKVFPIKIENFSERDQKRYTKTRLNGKYKNIDETVKDIFENTKKILENRHIVDVPLQLFIITEILIRNPEKINPNMFVVSRMFQYFISGKYRHFFEKRKCNHLDALEEIINDSKSYRLEQYKTAALKFCFTEEEFESLNVKQDKKFVEQIRKEGDFLGISSVSNNAVIFNHNVNTEYFGALYLAENWQNVRTFLETVLFKKKYGHIKLMFDMILAENCPAHIAILYRNIDEFRKCNKIDQTDKGGRSTLHLVCSHAREYPVVADRENEISDSDYKSIQTMQEIDKEYKYILNSLLEKQDPSTADSLFQWDALDYIDRSFFLLPLEVILEKYGDNYDISKLNILNTHLKTVLLYSALLDYHNLFKKIFPPALEPTEASDLLLLVAASSDNNNYKTVELLLDHKVDICSKTSREERNALHLASLHGHIRTVTLLLFKNNALVNFVDRYRRTPLHLAASNAHLQVIKELFKNGAEVDPVDKFGRTPLHLAVENGHFETIQFLVDLKKADIDKTAFNGWTPLHLAVVEGRSHIVNLLLEKGASFDKFDVYGTKPLHIAAKRRNTNIIQMLLDLSKNIEEETSDHRTCLHLAAEFGCFDGVKFLLEKGANIKAVDGNGKSVLHWAVLGGVEEIVNFLLEQEGINVNIRDNEGRSSLQWAAEQGLLNVVKLLVQKKAKINDGAENGSTALHWAARKGHSDIVVFLLENGAEIGSLDTQGRTPLDWAIGEEESETGHLLQTWDRRRCLME